MDIVLEVVMVHYLHFHMDHLLEVALVLSSFLIKKVVDLDNLEQELDYLDIMDHFNLFLVVVYSKMHYTNISIYYYLLIWILWCLPWLLNC